MLLLFFYEKRELSPYVILSDIIQGFSDWNVTRTWIVFLLIHLTPTVPGIMFYNTLKTFDKYVKINKWNIAVQHQPHKTKNPPRFCTWKWGIIKTKTWNVGVFSKREQTVGLEESVSEGIKWIKEVFSRRLMLLGACRRGYMWLENGGKGYLLSSGRNLTMYCPR